MVSRTTDDYERMAVAGCAAVCEPAFWAGFDRSSVDGFHDYFCQLTEHEPKRAAKFGLKHFCWLGITFSTSAWDNPTAVLRLPMTVVYGPITLATGLMLVRHLAAMRRARGPERAML